jgi:hypothetical protein
MSDCPVGCVVISVCTGLNLNNLQSSERTDTANNQQDNHMFFYKQKHEEPIKAQSTEDATCDRVCVQYARKS